jgi:acetyltransferase-like isoleucine patch superfamily enzyme
MAILPLRKITDRPNAPLAAAWLERIDAALDGAADRNELCRELLCEISYPEYATDWESAVEDRSLPLGTRLGLSALDPRNVTLEPEYYAECDDTRFQKVKPLLWLWYSFDRTALGGQNVELGVQLRRLLAPRIFKRCGENFKAFQHVEFSFGYNIEAGDNVVVHRHVLLDDRGGIEIGDNVSTSDYANIYSHSHDIYDIHKVDTPMTRIGNGVRITYHATVLAGTTVGDNALIGSHALVSRNVEPYHIVVGIPAKTVKIKDPNEVSKLV